MRILKVMKDFAPQPKAVELEPVDHPNGQEARDLVRAFRQFLDVIDPPGRSAREAAE